jgi:hypothetical protein
MSLKTNIQDVLWAKTTQETLNSQLSKRGQVRLSRKRFQP